MLSMGASGRSRPAGGVTLADVEAASDIFAVNVLEWQRLRQPWVCAIDGEGVRRAEVGLGLTSSQSAKPQSIISMNTAVSTGSLWVRHVADRN